MFLKIKKIASLPPIYHILLLRIVYVKWKMFWKNAITFQGEKKRDAGGTNEIVACTNCGGGSSPCTHSANNGCATEVIVKKILWCIFSDCGQYNVKHFFIADMFRSSTEKRTTTSNQSG